MTKHHATLAALATAGLMFSGCGRNSGSSQTHLAEVAIGHQITADIDGIASIENQSTQVVIASQFGPIVIDRSRVSLGNQTWTDIPEGASITLKISQDKYSVQWTASNSRAGTTIRSQRAKSSQHRH